MNINRAIITISEDSIADAFELPIETRIIDVRRDWNSGDFLIIIEHPDLPETPDGFHLEVVAPTVTWSTESRQNFDALIRRTVVDWGFGEPRNKEA